MCPRKGRNRPSIAAREARREERSVGRYVCIDVCVKREKHPTEKRSTQRGVCRGGVDMCARERKKRARPEQKRPKTSKTRTVRARASIAAYFFPLSVSPLPLLITLASSPFLPRFLSVTYLYPNKPNQKHTCASSVSCSCSSFPPRPVHTINSRPRAPRPSVAQAATG